MAQSTPRAVPGTDDDQALAESGRRVLDIETRALQALASRLDGDFTTACRLLLACEGRVVCTGMGKSGHIARKIAATLASTGTPAFYVHPGEAGHGDLGMVTDADVVLALSNSGETDELLMLLPVLKRQGNRLVAMTGRPGSTLAREADIHLDVSVPAEACPLDLAPTSSTTAALAMGDALAVALLERRGFTAGDFKIFHPGGKLGAQLQTVADLMHKGAELPLVAPDTPMPQALLVMTEKRFGCVGVEADGKLAGLITDGDLRRHMDGLMAHTAAEVMTANPQTVDADALAAEALKLMEDRRITVLFVLDHGRPAGILHIHDILRAGVV